MNADMLFQSAASMTTNLKTGNNRFLSDSVSGSNSSNSKGQQESFKSEMDKVFDRKSTSPKPKDNCSKDKVSQKSGQKQDPAQNDVNDVNDVDDVSEAQQDIAAQAQLIVTNPVMEQVPSIPVADQSIIAGSEAIQPLVGQTVQKQNKELLNVPAQVETNENEGISLPFQSRIDMVKAAMMKEAASQQQEPEVSKVTTQTSNVTQENVEPESTTKSSTKEQLIPQTKNDSPEPTKQEVPLMVKPEPLDLSKVNIKVADAPIDTTQSNLAEQFTDKILYKINEGKQEFDLQLNPKELGKLNIKLTFENGNAQVLITCANSKAQNMMASLTDNIRGILEANTGMSSTIHLQQDDMLQGQYNQDSLNQEGHTKQQSNQQEKKKESVDDISFMDKLRLGLLDQLETAV